MKIVTTAATLLVLSAATVWAQTSAPAPMGQPSAVGKPGGRVPAVSDKGAPTISPQIMELRQRMQAMQDTLTKMHAVLKEMRAKAASSGSKDQLTKANITMWELMLGQLDKDFEQLSKTTLTREDIEARRAAMYKQAMAKAAARREAALAAHEGTTPAAASQDSRVRRPPAKVKQVHQAVQALEAGLRAIAQPNADDTHPRLAQIREAPQNAGWCRFLATIHDPGAPIVSASQNLHRPAH